MKQRRILIIGGGIAGMSAAIELRKRDHQVDLVEIDSQWRANGTGITLSGPTLRAFTKLGVIQKILAEGWGSDSIDVFTAEGTALSGIPLPRIAGADVPGSAGILRPVLARILREHTLAAGVAARCGLTFQHFNFDAEGVEVTFSDGHRSHYELVIGADGLMSKVRATMFRDTAGPFYTGQVSWRAVVPKPRNVARIGMYMGPSIKAGFTPVSKGEMYLYVTEPRAQPDRIEEEKLAGELRHILTPFSGLVGEIRDGLGPDSRIIFRPFFAYLHPRPWHKNKVVLIGDAAHATTPHLASGAGIGVEDALVLAQELERSDDLDAALSSFMDRRFERCRIVIENSVRLGELESNGNREEEHSQLMRTTFAALHAPI